MKPWKYYETPVKHPWVSQEDIDGFIIKNHLRKGTDKFVVANYIWHRDDLTKSELSDLEYEFRQDVCKEFGISESQYDRLDPYDYIIGSPENHDYPCASQFREMYEYVGRTVIPKKIKKEELT